MTTFTTQDRQDAQRTPLTKEQITAIIDNLPENEMTIRELFDMFARAIERAHGIGE